MIRPVLSAAVLASLLVGACKSSSGSESATATTATATPQEPATPETPAAPPRQTIPTIPESTPLEASLRTPPADAKRGDDGLAWVVLTEGSGSERARPFDRVTFDVQGWGAVEGGMFEDTARRGRPLVLLPHQVMPGWTRTLTDMAVGEKRRVWIPDALAMPVLPEGGVVFEIEVKAIERMEEPPPVPSDVAAAPADAVCTATGLCSKVLLAGSGATHPASTDTVRVHYTGWKTDGTMFDSSVPRGEPARFPLDGVIPGWTEGLQLMVVGEKRRFWIPENLAYGGGREPKGMLVFDVELLEIVEAPRPPETPSDVAAAPRNAPCTASGLCSRVLTRGTGRTHPTAASRVRVHYSGWKTDGTMFDSSVLRGEPATFPLGGVIRGWTEGLQLMVVGEKRRFWIPEALAYGGNREPKGMLVFDVELLEIVD